VSLKKHLNTGRREKEKQCLRRREEKERIEKLCLYGKGRNEAHRPSKSEYDTRALEREEEEVERKGENSQERGGSPSIT